MPARKRPARQPRFRLADMDLDEISLVRAGDDAMARVVLAKADKSADSGVGGSTLRTDRLDQEDENVADNEGLAEILAKAELPDEVRAYIEALEDEIDNLSANDEGTDDDGGDDTDAGQLSNDDDDTDDADDKDEEMVLAKADPEVRRLIEKMDGDLKEARQQAAAATAIAKTERDERLRREFVAKAETLPMINDKPADLGDLLMKLHEKAPEEAARVETLLKAANEQISKGNLFKEMGRGIAGLGSRVEQAVAELRKSDPSLTQEQAVSAVYAAHPDLYDEEA